MNALHLDQKVDFEQGDIGLAGGGLLNCLAPVCTTDLPTSSLSLMNDDRNEDRNSWLRSSVGIPAKPKRAEQILFQGLEGIAKSTTLLGCVRHQDL